LEQEKKKTLADKVWDFLASVKLAIIIFAVISLTSIAGTILEQNAEPAKNLAILTKLFGKSLAPGLYDVLSKLGFINMYHSWWFTALLVLFSVNLIICSLDRLPRIWKLVRDPIGPLPEERLRKFSIVREVVLKGNPDKVRLEVTSAIKSAHFRYSEAQEEKGYQFYAQRGNYSRLGVYLTHFSILIILLGVIIGIRFGFNGSLNLAEGDMSDVAYSNSDKEIPLGFYIRCDEFKVEFYGNSDMPREYRSWLTVIKNGKEVLKKSVAVNDPLSYDGITFYQASYGLIPGGLTRGIFIFNVSSKGGNSTAIYPRFGSTFNIPGTDIEGKIVDFSPALQMNESGQAFTYANMMNNPAVYIDFSESGKHKFSSWILKRQPQTWELPDGVRVQFVDYWGVQYTGLQVRKDPGIWVVYFGCFAMSLGLFIAFFTSHRKIWVKVVEEKNNARVIVGATANKNRPSFERKIDKIASILAKNSKR
jgi:cytochrome c biogenesis protein